MFLNIKSRGRVQKRVLGGNLTPLGRGIGMLFYYNFVAIADVEARGGMIYALAIEVIIDIVGLEGLVRWHGELVDTRFRIVWTDNADIEHHGDIVVEGILHGDDEVFRMVCDRRSFNLRIALNILNLLGLNIDIGYEVRIHLTRTIRFGIQFDGIAIDVKETLIRQAQQRHVTSRAISEEDRIVSVFRNNILKIIALVEPLVAPLELVLFVSTCPCYGIGMVPARILELEGLIALHPIILVEAFDITVRLQPGRDARIDGSRLHLMPCLTIDEACIDVQHVWYRSPQDVRR